MSHQSPRRLSLAALVVLASFAAAAAVRAGGMPPEEEIDANGEPVAAPVAAAPATAAPTAVDDGALARPIPIPANYTLAAMPVSQPAPALSPAARVAMAPTEVPDPFRDHR